MSYVGSHVAHYTLGFIRKYKKNTKVATLRGALFIVIVCIGAFDTQTHINISVKIFLKNISV